MHSNLAPYLAKQHHTDLHAQAASYRTSHRSMPEQQADSRPQPAPRAAHRYLHLLQLAMETPRHR